MSNILTGFNMQGNDPIDDRIVSKSNLETLEQYLKRVPVQKRYYGLTFFALDKNNELRKYTFQTSLINPTIDDNEEEIERIDKELQEHVSDKAIHKTSEEIRSEIVDADIPDTIARVQWTLDQINTAVINLIGGASDEYNTLKRIQTKIEELRAKIYGDDGGTVLKTLEQALKFLNQYKDFIVDIPENFVNKQDIVDNLTTDDPTKVLSAKQGKVLSDTLTNYFESAMQSIRTETDRAINAENRIETKLDKEIDRSIKEDQRIDAKLDAEIKRSTDEDLRIDSKLDSEINRSTTEDDRLDKKIDTETTRATDAESNLNTKIETETDRAESEESRIEAKLDNEIARSTNKDTEHDNRLTALEGDTHEQNTDLGTTNSTFQLKYNTGNKIKHESDAISVRNAADTDYVNFIAKNATFKGDLLVEGQSFVTEAETVEIKDNLLLLNKGEVGAGVTKGIAGLEIDRGTEPNYQIIFDESDNRFKAGEIGDIQCLALRDGDNSMVNGMFTSWDSSTKRLKTTNIVPSDQKLSFGDNGDIELKYSLSKMGEIFSSAIPILNIGRKSSGYPHIEFGLSNSHAVVYTDALNGIYLQNQVLGRTFKRATDLSEVLYHADIVNNLTSGGTNKVLSAEQGKLLQNSITSIQGSYLPLSGGTMTGSINLPSTDPLKMIISGSVDSVLSYWPSNNAIEFGNNKRKIFLRTDNSNIIHYINGSSYSIYDTNNLPDPATLSGNNTFTGNNTFQAGKFNVGPFEVISSGSLLSNISSPAGSTWSRSLTFRANSDNTSKSIFGGYNSIDNTSIGYAYIGIGDVNHSTAQYKFYANSLKVPYKWSIDGPDGSAILWSQTSEIVNLGRAAGTTKIRSGNTDLIHTKDSTEYIIWDKSNLPTPASTTDLANYLPLIGGTLTGQLTIKQSVDIKLRLQSTDADNHCIIQAINAQASQLGVFGYAGDKWAIGHNGTYYEIWDKYNLTNPVRYALDASNYPTLLDSNGSSFSYIKAGPSGILPNTSVSLSSGGTGYCGTLGWSFKDGYFANVHTYKILIGPNDAFIDGQGGNSSHRGIGFYTSQNATCPVYVGSLCVSDGYANSAPYIPTNGIYSKGNIRTSGWLTFEDNEWTDTGWAYKDAKGSIKVLSVTNEANNKPTSYGSVLQFNSRQGHWCTQIWCDQTNVAGVIGTLRFRTTKSYASTEWNPWTSLVTEFDLNSYLTKTEASTLYYPYSGRGYLSITSTGKPVMSNNQGYAVKDKDGNEREVLWMGTNNALYLGNTSQYTLGQLDLRCTTLTHNDNKIATQNYVTNQLSNYLPLSGGTISSSKSNPLTINSTHASQSSIDFSRGGVNKGTVGFYESLGSFLQNVTGETLAVKSDGAYYGVNINSLRKLATVTDLNNYLPLIGGALSGTLTIDTIGSNPFVINNNDTNGSETFMRVLRKGTASAAIGFMDSLGAYIYNYNSNKYLFIDNDGYARIGTTSGSTRLALITDIPSISGYLPLSGGTMSGNISFNGGTGHIVVGARETSNFVSAVSFNKGSATNSAYIGYHSTGGSDSSGALILVPYSTSANPWAKTVGLYIAKNELLLDGKAIATQEYVNNRSVSWSNITGKPSTYTPSAHSHNSLQIEDNRGVTMLPNNMGPTTLRTFFNANNMPTSDWYSGIHISGWVTNYAAWELCGPSSNNTTTASSLYFRSGKDSTWNSWKKIAFTSDIPTIPSISISNSGSGNAVTSITASGHTLTVTKGATYLTSSSLDGYATQSWSNSQYPLKTGTGASGTWGISITGNATTATTASKLGSTTIGGSAKPIYLSSGTPTACSATVGSATVPVYMNAGTITQCSTTLGVSITGNAATATNATQLGGTAASSYVKANDNISRLTNDSGYTTQEWVNGQGFLTSDSLLDKFVPTTGGYIRNSDQVLLRLQRTGVSTGTSRTIEMYFDDSNTDGTSTTPRGSIGYNSEVGMFLYSAKSKKFLAMEYTGRPFYGTSENRYYLLGSNTQYHNLDGYQRIGDIMIQWGYFSVQGNSTRAVNFPVSFTNTVWSVTGSWDNTAIGNQENWGFTDYTSSGFTIINGDGSSRVFHYIAIGPFTRS